MIYALIGIGVIFLYGVVRFYDGLIRGIYKRLEDKE